MAWRIAFTYILFCYLFVLTKCFSIFRKPTKSAYITILLQCNINKIILYNNLLETLIKISIIALAYLQRYFPPKKLV